MQIGIILQARCNSKRLPNKVIRNIKHKAYFELIIERHSKYFSNTINSGYYKK